MTQRNKFAEHKTIKEKTAAYTRDCGAGVLAYKSDNTTVPLHLVPLSSVEFVAGLWRVQDVFDRPIQRVRDIDVVLGDKLPHTERIPFEYYRAYRLGENCYGKYVSARPDMIVAKYTTNDGTFWGYGPTIEAARAFLGIKLYDQYSDLIHAHACGVKTRTPQK